LRQIGIKTGPNTTEEAMIIRKFYPNALMFHWCGDTNIVVKNKDTEFFYDTIIDKDSVGCWGFVPDTLGIPDYVRKQGMIATSINQNEEFVLKTYSDGKQANRLRTSLGNKRSQNNNIYYEELSNDNFRVSCPIDEIDNLVGTLDFYTLDSYLPTAAHSEETQSAGSQTIPDLHPKWHEALMAGLGVRRAHELGQ
jgi:hypothetical protein